MPILDLWIRKGVRRNGVKLAVATARPSALDRNAALTVRYAPGEEAALLAALAGVLRADYGEPAQRSGVMRETVRALADLLRGGEDVVIVWGERLDAAALPHLLEVARRLGLADRRGAGLLEVPVGANGRGLREAGVLPNAGPGYASVSEPGAGRSAAEVARAAARGELTALYLFEIDPLRDLRDRQLWNDALHHASLVVAHAAVLTDGLREHAMVVFPAESNAEKEGTLVHPDGRLQRLRSAIGHPDQVRAGWWVLAELGKRIGLDAGVLTSSMAFAQLADAVPFYRGLTLDEIGGRGVRWPERDGAADLWEDFSESAESRTAPAGRSGPLERAEPSQPLEPSTALADSAVVAGDRSLRLGTYRPIWAAPEVELSPVLHYTIASQLLELSPEDAWRLGISSGERVVVSQNGTRVHATAHIRTGVRAGTAFLAEGIAHDSANILTGATITVAKAEAGSDSGHIGRYSTHPPEDGRGNPA
jgi:NADH-quinone oxidoreductase subunit G